MCTSTGHKINRNGKHYKDSSEIAVKENKGNSFKLNGEYYYLVGKRIDMFIYVLD